MTVYFFGISGGGIGGNNGAIASAAAKIFSSEPGNPSSSTPIGKPVSVADNGRIMPSNPALLPGSVFRIKVWNVGTEVPLFG